MEQARTPRHILIALVLILGIFWSFGSAEPTVQDYPNARFLVTPQWLKAHRNDSRLVIADVRADKYFTGGVIPGAVRLPWSEFRTNNTGTDTASVFIGVDRAQKILGRHGITADDTVVLYDSVQRDGGATASYVFWVLDVLGHKDKKLLDRGVDGWKEAGFDLAATPNEPAPLLYQARQVRTGRLIDGRFVYNRLGDPFYQIIDVRSQAEYTGEKGTRGLDGSPLKRGHIPSAVNVNYVEAWASAETKSIKSYAALQDLYKGVDPGRGVIVYCNSGRRSSFSYFILRLMGFDQVYTYEASWKEWGHPDNYFPVETRTNTVKGTRLPQASGNADAQTRKTPSPSGPDRGSGSGSASGSKSGSDSGYVSCGG